MTSPLHCRHCGFYLIAHQYEAGRAHPAPHPYTMDHVFEPATRPEPDPEGKRCVFWAEDPDHPHRYTCLTHGVLEDAGHAFATGRLNTLD
jgi:hypothetical protein